MIIRGFFVRKLSFEQPYTENDTGVFKGENKKND